MAYKFKRHLKRHRNSVVLIVFIIILIIYWAKYTRDFNAVFNALRERRIIFEKKARNIFKLAREFELPRRYVHPLNKSITGLPFKLDLNTRQLADRLITRLQNGVRVENIITDVLSKTLTPVTGISGDHHFDELMINIEPFRHFIKLINVKLIVYDLSLNEEQVSQLKRTKFIIYRKFNFSVYPEHVKTLTTYAFKFLIIQEVMAEKGVVFWMDASIYMRQNFNAFFKQMEKKKTGVLHYISHTGHTIFAATHPQMIDYLPPKNLSHFQQDMVQSGGMILMNTKTVRENIMPWAILCSLDKNCIAPEGSTLAGCRSKPLDEQWPKDRFGGCHRYDQSMIAILVTNAFNGQRETYTEDPGHPLVDVYRREGHLVPPK